MTFPAIPVTFQACIGPSMSKLHIRGQGGHYTGVMSLCMGVVVVTDYRASAQAGKICQNCVREFVKATGKKASEITAQDFGLSAII